MALKLKSSNTQGNPYHDEEGKFTSAGNEGAVAEKKGSDPLMNLFGSLGKSMRDSETEEKEAMKLFGFGGKEEAKNATDKNNKLEEKEASKYLGVDVSDNKARSLKAGYDEEVVDAPDTLQVMEGDFEHKKEVDVTKDDLINFLKYHKIDFSPEDEQLIRDNGVIPSRLLDNLAPKGYSYTSDDLYDDLIDFKGYFKE